MTRRTRRRERKPVEPLQVFLRLSVLFLFCITCCTCIQAHVPDQHQFHDLHRNLQSSNNDWSQFNEILSRAVLQFPDSELESAGLTLRVTDLTCSNLSIKDIDLWEASRGTQNLQLDLALVGLDMICTARYEFFGLLIVNGSGDLLVESMNNAALLQTLFTSLDYRQYPPHDSSIVACQPTINIHRLDFSNGGFWGFTLDTLQGMFRGRFEDLAEQRLCQELQQASNQDMDDLLNDIQNYFVQYPSNDNIQIDPLATEQAMLQTPSSASAFFGTTTNTAARLINWQQPDTYPFGFWMDRAWQDTVAYLNTQELSPYTNTLDTNANILLRQHLLNPQGLLVMNTTDAPDNSNILYEGHDKWMKTQIKLHQVQIKGLDTLTLLDPLVNIGMYTLQSKLSWKSLAIALDIELDISPSTRQDSYIGGYDSGTTTNIKERMTVEVSMDQVDAGIGILLALDQDKLEALQVGHFLDKDNLLPCFLTSIHDVQVSALSVEAVDLEPPRIVTTSSSLSQGLYDMVTSAVNAGLYMYESTMLRSSKAFFQTVIRDIVNQALDAQQDSLTQGQRCTLWELPLPHGHVNVQQLLLEQATTTQPAVPLAPTSTGSSSLGRYGNLFHEFVMPTLKNELLTDDKLNQRFIRPFTLDQSGREGILVTELGKPLIEVTKQGTGNPYTLPSTSNTNTDGNSTIAATTTNDANWVTLLGWEQFQFQAKDAILYNVDTITSPVDLFHPLDAQLLGNTIRTGDDTPDKPLQFTLQLIAQATNLLQGQRAMKNHVELMVEIPTSVLVLETFVAMNETKLLEFPLGSLENEFCWLAALSTSQLPNHNDNQQAALHMEKIITGLASSMTFHAECFSCSSPGGEALPEVIRVLTRSGLVELFQPYLEDLLSNVLMGAWANMNFAGMIADAPRLCPHDARYDPQATPRDDLYGAANAFSAPPKWTRQSAETITAVGFLSLYASLFLVAQNHMLQPPPLVLSQQEQPPPATSQSADGKQLRLLDWTNLGGTLGPWADEVLHEARLALQVSVMNDLSPVNATRYLSEDEAVEEAEEYDATTGSRLLQADSFIRDHMLDEQGSMTFAFEDMQFEVAGIGFTLQQVRAKGIDSLTHLDPFVVMGPQTLQNNAVLRELNVTLDLEVDLGAGDTHNMTMSVDMQDVTVEFPLFLAMDLDKLGTIELGSLLQINRILPCLLQGAHEVYIPRLNVTIGAMSRPNIEGFMAPGLHAVLDSMNRALFDIFGEELTFALPGLFDTTIRRTFNTMLHQYVAQVDPTRCSVEAGGATLDFRDLFLAPDVSKDMGGSGRQQYGDLFQTLHNVMRQELETKDGEPPSFNNFLSSWTAKHFNESGSVEIPGNLLDTTASMKLAGLEAVLAFQLGDIALENVDTLGAPLSLLDPLNAHTLNNTASFGVGEEPLKVKARLMLAISDNEEMQVRNEVDVSVEIENARAAATILLRMREDGFLKFPLKDVPNIFCWLSTIVPSKDNIYGISLVDQSLSLGSMDLNVSCVSCTSPQFGDLIADLYTPESADEATETVLQTLSQILDGEAIQDFLDQVVAEASSQCPHSADYNPEAVITASQYLQNQAEPFAFTDFTTRDDRSSYFNIASAVFAAFLLLIFVIGKLVIHRSNKKWKESLSPEGMLLLRRQKAREKEQEEMIDMHSASLFQSPQIPAKIRWAVPALILLNIGLYLGGHLGVLSTVNLDVHLAGEEFTIHNFLVFSFIESTTNTYKNGGMEMSIMLWIFTGIWPYVKLSSSLFLWLVPPRILSVSNRGKLLLWIDALTKLSIIDIFTMILVVAVLLVYIGGPDEALDAEGALYSMKVIVVPGASCYCIVIAQRISRVSSRFFLDCHEKVVVAAREACSRGDIASMRTKTPKSNDKALADQIECSDSGWAEKINQEEEGEEEQSSLSLSSEQKKPDNGPSVDDSLGSPTATESVNLPLSMYLTNRTGTGTTMSSTDQEISSILEGRLPPAPEHVGDHDRECPSVAESERSIQNIQTNRCSMCSRLKQMPRHHLGLAFGVLAVLVLFVIGCIYAPSVSVEISDLWALALESGTTFAEAATEYGVFSIVSAVLLQSRFVLNTTWDYVALGFLLAVAFISMGMVLFIGCFQLIRRFLKEGWSALRPTQRTPAYELPSYLRLYAYKHFEIYVVAVVVGCWQLGSVSIYAIHLYCSILDSVYKVLTYVGLAQASTAQCYEAQMLLIDNLLVFFGALLILLAKFWVQCSTQYRKNVEEASDLLRQEDHDVDKLSSLWNTPSSAKRSFWSSSRKMLNETASFSDFNSAIQETPSSYATADESPSSHASARSSAPLFFTPDPSAEYDSVSLSGAIPRRLDLEVSPNAGLPSQ